MMRATRGCMAYREFVQDPLVFNAIGEEDFHILLC